jgi:hypothetical protein
MRDGNVVPKGGGAQTLASDQAMENGCPGNAVMVLENQSGLFKSALLAGNSKIQNHVGQRQNTRQEIHDGHYRGECFLAKHFLDG